MSREGPKVGSLEPSRQIRHEKSHAAVAQSTFPSENVKKEGFRPLLEVGSFTNGTPLWREAHFQVKMLENPHAQTTFGSWKFQKWHAAVARSTFPSQNAKKLTGSAHFWELQV